MSIDVENVNCSHSCPPIVWVWPVGSKVTSSLGIAGAPAAWACSRAASNTWAVFWLGVSTITCRAVRSVMVDTLCPITSMSVRAFVPLTRMIMRGIAPLIIAAIGPSMVTSVVTVTSARTAAEPRATSAQIARQRFMAATIPTVPVGRTLTVHLDVEPSGFHRLDLFGREGEGPDQRAAGPLRQLEIEHHRTANPSRAEMNLRNRRRALHPVEGAANRQAAPGKRGAWPIPIR